LTLAITPFSFAMLSIIAITFISCIDRLPYYWLLPLLTYFIDIDIITIHYIIFIIAIDAVPHYFAIIFIIDYWLFSLRYWWWLLITLLLRLLLLIRHYFIDYAIDYFRLIFISFRHYWYAFDIADAIIAIIILLTLLIRHYWLLIISHYYFHWLLILLIFSLLTLLLILFHIIDAMIIAIDIFI
jgi:hypothetical protein